MTVPLMILAAFALLLGFIGTPLLPWFQTYLTGEVASANAWTVLLLMLISTIIVAAGIGLGWWLYGRKPVAKPQEPDALEQLQPAAFEVLRNKFFVDELYGATVVWFNAWFSQFCEWLDRVVLGGSVGLISYGVLGVSWLSRLVDEYIVNLGFDQGCERLRSSGGFLSRLQDGQVQNYLRVIGLALTLFLLLLTWGCGK
jgi:NADH-quinone oxidoreductase subunit L